MKKTLKVLMAALSLCCLTGCGNSDAVNNNAGKENPTPTVTEAATPTTATPVPTEAPTATQEVVPTSEPAPTEVPVEEGNAYDIAEGTYNIDVESSSSMFKVTKAELIVTENEMNAVITLSGTGYGKLYLGTGEAAVAASEADYINYVEDAEGAYTFAFPVTALDQPIDVAAFSNKKAEWYDRQLTFLSASVAKKVADGVYSIEVTLGGGSGRTTVISPAKLTVANGAMVATIEWTSPNYDYMIVGGEKYLQVNTEGNSVFEIPVAALNVELDVIGDTVAMSKPREIEYTLTFHSESMTPAE